MNTPTDRWKDRFHRGCIIGSFSAYVSRPTFDMARRSDKKGMACRNNLLDVLTNFRVDEKASKSTIEQWFSINKENEMNKNDLRVIFNIAEKHIIFAIGPFDVSTEMKESSKGILFHYHRIEGETKTSELVPVADCREFLNQETKHPMQNESLSWCHDKLMETLEKIGIEKTILETDPDPSAARLLPTEPMFEFEANGDFHSRFRNLMCLQFLEVRLVMDPTNINIEQSLALDAYDYAFSSCMNHTGRPGTGKTTIAQIDLCESLLQRGGKERGERKALYIATTSDLIDEARIEIRGLLDYVFDLHKYEVQKNKLLESIRFCSEDDFLERVPAYAKLTRETLGKALTKVNQNITPENREKWDYWLRNIDGNDKETFSNLDELYRVLRMFIYGVFGSVSNFCKWMPVGKEDSQIEEIFNSEINTINPLSGLSKVGHSLKPKYFWNPFTKRMNNKESCQLIRSLAEILESPDGLGRYLYDRGDLSNDGYWDSSAVIYGISKDIIGGEEDVGLSKIGLWSKTKEKRFDSIFIDESQDFSVLFLVMVLRHFAIRQVKTSENNMPFSFICAGDAYQTIRGSLFQTGMEHINAAYEDWKRWLDDQRIANQPSPIDGLPTTVRRDLSANYRNPEVVVGILNHIVDNMKEVALSDEMGIDRRVRGGRKQESDAKRRGIVSLVPTEGNPTNIEIWKPALNQVISQLQSDESRIECKVTMVSPSEQFNNSKEITDIFSEHRILITNSDILEQYETIESEIERIITDMQKENLDEAVIIATLAERGICSIESVKGLTKPVVILIGLGKKLTAKEEEMESDRSQQQCYELLMRWSHFLVGCSRPQFGLLVIDNLKDYKRATGEVERSQITLTSDFEQVLKFTSVSPTDIDSTLRRSIMNPNQTELWERLRRLSINDSDDNVLSKVSYWLAANHISVLKASSATQAIERESIPRDAESALIQIGHREFLEPYPIATANTFIAIQKIIRAAGEDEKAYTGAIHELKIVMQEMEESKPPNDERIFGQPVHLSQWLNYIAGESESVNYLDAKHTPEWSHIDPFAWNETDAPRLPSPDQFGIRLEMQKWYFPAPKEESERQQHWMATRGIWPFPPKELRNIISKVSGLENKSYDWHLLLLEGDPKEILDVAIEYADKGDKKPLFWLLEAIIIDSNQMNSKMKLSILLQIEIINRLKGKDKKFVGFVKSWLLSSSQGVPTRLNSFSIIVDRYSSEGSSKQSITRQLDFPLILAKWFKVKYSDEEIITNGKVIENSIKRLGNQELGNNIKISIDLRKYLIERQSSVQADSPLSEKQVVDIGLMTKKFIESLTSPVWGEFTALHSSTIQTMLHHNDWAQATYDLFFPGRKKIRVEDFFLSINNMIKWIYNSGKAKGALMSSFKPIIERMLEKSVLQPIIGKSTGSKFERVGKYDLVYHILNKEDWEQVDISKLDWRDGHRFWIWDAIKKIRGRRMPEITLTGDPRYEMTPQKLGKHQSSLPYKEYPEGCANHFMLNINTLDGYLKWMKKSKSKGPNEMKEMAIQFIRGGALHEAATILMLIAADEASKVKTPKLKVEKIVQALALVIMLPAFVYGVHISSSEINWKTAQKDLLNNRGAKSHTFVQKYCTRQFYLKPMRGDSWGNPKSSLRSPHTSIEEHEHFEKFFDADSKNPNEPFIAFWNNVANFQKALICGRRLLLALEKNPIMNPSQYLSMIGEQTFSRKMFSKISGAKTVPNVREGAYGLHGFGKLTKQEFSSCDELNWLLSLEGIDQLIDLGKSEKFIMNSIAPKSMRNCRGTLGQNPKSTPKSKRGKSALNEEQDDEDIMTLEFIHSKGISLEDIKEKFSD